MKATLSSKTETRVPQGIVAVLVLFSLLGGCSKRTPQESHFGINGIDWMSWTPVRRDAFVIDFSMGYVDGSLDACARANSLFRVDDEPRYSPKDVDPFDLATRCQSHIDNFTKYKTITNRSSATSPYTDPITAFYTNHPDKRYIEVSSVLLGLRDSTYYQYEPIYMQK